MAREPTAGPDSGPEYPFPIQLGGRIIKGFGRGSKELGIPTANLPISGLEVGGHSEITNGVYFGWAGISLKGSISDASKAAEPLKGEELDGGALKYRTANPSQADSSSHPESPGQVYKVVLSIGYNPYYKNEVRSVEVHVMHKFDGDFYNAMMNLSIQGFIRTEQDYDSMQALIDDINTDVKVADQSLERQAYIERKNDPFLLDFAWGG